MKNEELFPVYNRKKMNVDIGPPCCGRSAWQSEAAVDCNLDLAAQILLYFFHTWYKKHQHLV